MVEDASPESTPSADSSPESASSANSESTPSESSKITLPLWASLPFHTFLNRHGLVSRLLHLSMSGIRVLRGMPKVLEVLSEVDGPSTSLTAKRLDRAREEAALAEREVKNGFPLLHEQATIALWAALENLIRTFLSQWLRYYPNAMGVEQVTRLRVRIGEYEPLDQDERCLYIVDLLEQELSTSLRSGVTRFESVLGIFGLNGKVDDTLGKNLYELHQVRNVFVHRNGIVDKKILRACPWFAYKPGDAMVISHDAVGRYASATGYYANDLVYRVGDKLGIVGLRDDVARRVGYRHPISD
jgi:hypothetical protein